MDLRPFTRLRRRRRVEIDWMPEELRNFYAMYEGVGLASTPKRFVRLCKLAEVASIEWADLHLFDGYESPRGWRDFSAIRVGVSSFGDEILWILRAPSAPTGSVMTLGPDVTGPGGSGDDAIEGSLVLSDGFGGWIERLGRDGWCEYGLVPGEIEHQPSERQDQLREHFRRLNPLISWAAKK